MKFKVGDKVKWSAGGETPNGTKGTIIEVGYAAGKIKWDDGVIGTFPTDRADKDLPFRKVNE